MSERHSFFSATLVELKRRKVLRTVGAYAVAVFVFLQLMDAAVEPLRLPDWVPTLLVIGIILGFPLAFLLAWHLEIRPHGIYRTSGEGLLTRTQSAFLLGLMLLMTAGLAGVFYQYYSGVFNAPPSDAPGGEVARDFSAPENSIAVLPFADLSPDGDQGYMADGISEEILNLLARVDGLRVAARTSSFAFRESSDDIRNIGRLLNVRTVLEGSIRTSGKRIRLTAQLINVEDGFHIWSKDFDREMTDVFQIQDEVASNIAAALVDSFEGLETRPQTRTDSLAAAQSYRTGRLHWWRRTPEELRKSIEFFARALEHDSQFAPAYAAMADTWLLLSLYGNVTTVRAIEKAQTMIDKALAIDPESAEAFAALGLARWQIRQMDAAESALRHAVELNEDYIPAELWLAGVLGEQGRFPEEYRVLEQAMTRDPLNELLMVNYAGNLSMRGDWEQGRTLMRDLLNLNPDSTLLLRSLAKLELSNGNLVEGWKLADRAYRLAPENPEDVAQLAHIWLMLGDVEEAERLLQAALDKSGQNAGLLGTYWQALMVAGRYEEAEAQVREWMNGYGNDLPAALQRQFNLRLGMIALLRGDDATAGDLLLAALEGEDEPTYSGDSTLAVTLASLALSRMGEEAKARDLLEEAGRSISRGRLNGVDEPGIYYSEAVMFSMQDQPEQALAKLQQAYNKGFRECWVLDIDDRLAPLREHPEFIGLVQRIRDDVDRARMEIRALAVAAS